MRPTHPGTAQMIADCRRDDDNFETVRRRVDADALRREVRRSSRPSLTSRGATPGPTRQSVNPHSHTIGEGPCRRSSRLYARRPVKLREPIRSRASRPARFPAGPVQRAGGLMNHRFACLMVAGLALVAVREACPRHPFRRPSRRGRHPRRRRSSTALRARRALVCRGAQRTGICHSAAQPLRRPRGRGAVGRWPQHHRCAQTTATDARKWVLGPYETVTISGWQTSQTEARRFEFTTEARSYGQALGKTANLGVISAVFFKERVPRTFATARTRPASRRRRRRRAAAPAGEAAAAARGEERPTRSTPRPAWAVGPATLSRRCGWTSKTHRRRR